MDREFLRRIDRRAEEMPRPDLNPYVRSHRDFGPEVIPASDAPGRDWGAEFGRDAPLHVEIGPGNGFYLSGMAALHPEADWVGVELRYKRVVLAARKLRAAGLQNARVARWDAWSLDALFAPGSLAGLHVNHPDPWPRDKQAHRRLVGPALVGIAERLLREGGELRLKTDFAPHVTALLDNLAGFQVLGVVKDVRRDGAPWPDEVRTNYQRKSDEKGVPVHAVWAIRRGSPSRP